jgi:hypothetical protein
MERKSVYTKFIWKEKVNGGLNEDGIEKKNTIIHHIDLKVLC